MTGKVTGRPVPLQTQKQIRILENRLEKMYHKYNESKSRNQMLRTGIDNLRRERLVFDDIHRKLAKALLVKKKEMAGVIAHTNHILEARDKVGAGLRYSTLTRPRTACTPGFSCLSRPYCCLTCCLSRSCSQDFSAYSFQVLRNAK